MPLDIIHAYLPRFYMCTTNESARLSVPSSFIYPCFSLFRLLNIVNRQALLTQESLQTSSFVNFFCTQLILYILFFLFTLSTRRWRLDFFLLSMLFCWDSQKQQEMNKNKEIIVLDHKRSNAINIGMTKLPPPRSIKTAILKMDATIMNREGIEVYYL